MTHSKKELIETCGCRLERMETDLRIAYCPLHAQAPAMQKALQELDQWFFPMGPRQVKAIEKARAILRAIKETTRES